MTKREDLTFGNVQSILLRAHHSKILSKSLRRSQQSQTDDISRYISCRQHTTLGANNITV